MQPVRPFKVAGIEVQGLVTEGGVCTEKSRGQGSLEHQNSQQK